jgi:hypothetical protein
MMIHRPANREVALSPNQTIAPPSPHACANPRSPRASSTTRRPYLASHRNRTTAAPLPCSPAGARVPRRARLPASARVHQDGRRPAMTNPAGRSSVRLRRRLIRRRSGPPSILTVTACVSSKDSQKSPRALSKKITRLVLDHQNQPILVRNLLFLLH